MALQHSSFGKFGLNRLFSRFCKDSSATVTQIFALSSIPFFLAAGAAIDGARINDEHSKFMAAIDSAVIAVAADDRAAVQDLSGNELEARMAELEDLAAEFVKKNYHSSGDIAVDLEITGQKVKLDASFQFPTTIMSLVGIDEVNMNASSTVQKAMRPIELVMVMDTTGSMSSGGKIAGAKTAAHSLLTTLYGGTLGSEPRSEFLRTALVPFAAAVRLDTAGHDFNTNWIDTTGANYLSKINFDAVSAPAAWNNYYAWSRLKRTSSAFHTWNGCVEARARGTASTDYHNNDAAPVSGQPNTLFPAYFALDTPSEGSFGYNYISKGTTGTVGTECYGLTTTQCNSTTTANRLLKQENYRKYDGTNIGAESTSANGPWSGCAVSKVVSMTYDRGKVEEGIDAMTASGPTNIGEGLAWGWRVISPGEPFTKVQGSGSLPNATIAPYGDARWQKVIVLMTDGDNDLSPGGYGFNNTIYSANGLAGEAMTYNRFGTTNSGSVETAMDNDMLSVCTKVKEAGIALYVASFGSGVSTATRNRLQACSTGTGYYQHANAPSDLAAFFNHIGQDVINKSIYVSK
jgi:Putative Flp pilus-assembly TadE/G-like